MKNPLFTGVCTAMVTPFLDGKVNYPMMQQLLHRQYQAGIRSFVIAGTTGESATLADEEKLQLTRCAKDALGESCLVFTGTGSNCTSHALELSRKAQEAGADGVLVVSPYYNKASENGIVAHYLAIAQAVSIPVIAYNVPTRTGLDMPVSVYKRLSRIPNIAGVKEAGSDLSKLTKTLGACGPDFTLWSGNDDLAVGAIAMGASGLISVVSNLFPAETEAMVSAALAGDLDTAGALLLRLMPLLELLQLEVNPIPIKAAMALQGLDCGGCRLPLTPLSREKTERLSAFLQGS